LSNREKLKARKKLEKEVDDRFSEQTGIRNEADDYDMENMIKKYEYDMAQIDLQDSRKKGAVNKRKVEIDPKTGKPKQGVEDEIESHPEFESFQEELEELAKVDPSFAKKEFQEMVQKASAAESKKEELYGDDEPYDAAADEIFNEDAQLENL